MPRSTFARADKGKNVKTPLTSRVPVFLTRPFPSNPAGFMAALPLPPLLKFPNPPLLPALPWGGSPKAEPFPFAWAQPTHRRSCANEAKGNVGRYGGPHAPAPRIPPAKALARRCCHQNGPEESGMDFAREGKARARPAGTHRGDAPRWWHLGGGTCRHLLPWQAVTIPDTKGFP